MTTMINRAQCIAVKEHLPEAIDKLETIFHQNGWHKGESERAFVAHGEKGKKQQRKISSERWRQFHTAAM